MKKPTIVTNNLTDFALKFFDKDRRTSGPKNPVRMKVAAKEARKSEAILKDRLKTDSSLRDSILGFCAITGKSGEPGDEIRPALIKVERTVEENVIIDTFRILVHNSVRKGRKYAGGKISSVRRRGMKARILTTRIGGDSKPVANVYGPTA